MLRSLIFLFLLAVPPYVRADSGPGMDHGYLKLSFDWLAGYTFVAPANASDGGSTEAQPSGDDQIPANVKAWNGRKAMITGFMLPTQLENGKAVEFLIMANQMACCFGQIPKFNEWVIVRMPGGTPVIMDVPLSFYGVLKVGPVNENGCLVGIYEMDAERMGRVQN